MSARPPQDGNHQAPGAGGGVGPRLGQRAELSACVNDALEMANRSNVERQAVYPRHRHHLAGGEVFEHAQQFAPVGPAPLAFSLWSFTQPSARSWSSCASSVCP